MIYDCGEYGLDNEEALTVKKIVAPDEEYIEKIDRWTEFINWVAKFNKDRIRRLMGEFKRWSKDYYFIGEVNSKIVGHLWYTTSVANKKIDMVRKLGFKEQARIGDQYRVNSEKIDLRICSLNLRKG